MQEMDMTVEVNASPMIGPRQYQLQLLEYVTENNAIIYLPTGAGKTFVAIMAIKRFSAKMNRTIENGGKRAIFMCKTVELVRQQATELRKHTSLKIGLYIGERGVDNWSPERWKKEIDENQVLVGTAQIFLNIVSRNLLKITDLSIVIIDECHHGTKKDAMHEFMRMFQFVSDTTLLPRVIGLTGVLHKGNKLNNIMESLRNLEITFHSKITTVSSREEFLNVLIHSTCPKEEWLRYESSVKACDVNDVINTQISSILSVISEFDIGNHPIKLSKGLAFERGPSQKRSITKLLNEFSYHFENYGLYCSLFVLQSAIIDIEMKYRTAETLALRRMFRVVITLLESIHHVMNRKFKEFLTKKNLRGDDCHQVEVILEFSTPKVVRLLEYIETTFSNKQKTDISCLIFVERRLTARAICNVLKKFVNSKPNLKEILFPEFVVGRDSIFSNAVENILERKWNKRVMSDFRQKLCNMIVASNVLEEGIDIQACNFVIVFDQLKTFNSYIQTKGRARSKESTYIIAVSEKNAIATADQVRKYQEIQNFLQKFLIERTLNWTHPSQEEIDEKFADDIPPLKAPNGACLLASSALTTLNRYCQMLPWDIFGCLLPVFKKLHNLKEDGVIVSVKLPLQSRVSEEIVSDCMENVKMAKVSAAVKACQRLYEEGELNETFLPTSRIDCITSISDVLFKHWQKHKDNVTSKKVGKAKLRLYERKCPDEFYNALPVVGEECYAYKIVLVPEFEPNEYNNHVIEAFKTCSKHAILLRKRLPPLAVMPLFMQQGSLKVHIKESVEFVISSEEQLSKLRKYHLMLMRDLLQCWRSFFVHDTRNKQNSFLIVPLRGNEIDWDIVQRFDKLKPLCKPSINERQNKKYTPDEWLGKIVAKWYTPDTSERFLVTKVNTDQTPLTEFSDDQFESHLQYFECRYGSEIERIVDQTQFLIEVKPLTARRNFFNNAKYKDKVIQRETQKIVLVPELCHNFEFPGDLWLQALFLPSILHRLHFLLHAEHLRQRVNTFLGLSNLFENYRPMPLTIDVSLRRAVDSDGNACNLYEKTPVLLPPLPTSSQQSVSLESNSLVSNDDIWKEYEEPINFARHFNIYSIELQYFHNFEQKWAIHHNLRETAYTSDQLQKPNNFDRNVDAELPSSSSSQLAIKDQSIEQKCRIEILEQSLPKQQSKPLKSAEQYEFLAALTTSNANDVFDNERFELLGDSFLKFSMSLYLVDKFPNWHEGFLTEVKSKLVSNRNLLYCLLETDIPTCISSNIFSKDEWLPPLVSLPFNILEFLENDPTMHALVSMRDLFEIELNEVEVCTGRCSEKHLEKIKKSCQKNAALSSDGLEVNLQTDLNYCTYKEVRADKIIADTLEALLGVCVKNYGIQRSFRMLEFFGLCRPEHSDRPLTELLDFELSSPLLRTELSAREIDAFLINHERLEANLGYTFRNRAYLLEALTHPSFPANRLTGCYQKLEFIGDAILDFLMTCHIFERYQTMTPGMLTDLRSALVNNITLACICVRNRFHLFLLAENFILSELIQKFVEFQETQGHRITDQVRILLEETDVLSGTSSMNISQNVEVPKVLGDIVEALIAAVYLDSHCLHTTWNVIYRLFEQELNEFGSKVPIDSVRQLYEHPSAKPEFHHFEDKGTTAVKCVFYCRDNSLVVYGFGANKWQAKKAAAKHALRILAKV